MKRLASGSAARDARPLRLTGPHQKPTERSLAEQGWIRFELDSGEGVEFEDERNEGVLLDNCRRNRVLGASDGGVSGPERGERRAA